MNETKKKNESHGNDEDEDFDEEEYIKEVVDPVTYSYLLTWISFINKLS